MTTLTLVELWAAPVSDLSDTVNIRVRTETETVGSDSTLRRYAGGRDRVVTGPGSSQTVSFTAVNVDRADYQTLRDRLGTVQLFREPRGRRVYGTMLAVTGEEWRAREDTLGTVTITVRRVTYDEAV